MVHFAVRGLPLSSSRSVFQLSCQPTKSLYIRSWGCDPPSFVMHIKCIGPFDWCFFFFSPLESGKANIYLSPAGGESVILYSTGLFAKEPEWVYIYVWVGYLL